MEDPYPFTASFGLADNRDHCIKSAISVYKRLLRFTPGANDVPFETIGVLAHDISEDGKLELNEDKVKSLVLLFRPDRHDELPLLAFVQSCDWVYKKLRYLRASVTNSTRIDVGEFFRYMRPK